MKILYQLVKPSYLNDRQKNLWEKGEKCLCTGENKDVSLLACLFFRKKFLKFVLVLNKFILLLKYN